MLSLTLGVASRGAYRERRGIAVRLGEALFVGVFSVLSLSSLWLCAAIITRAVEASNIFAWFVPTDSGVGLFMVLAATSLWTLMLPHTVAFVRDEYRLFVAFFSGLTAARGR
jgi:hypothetical protein